MTKIISRMSLMPYSPGMTSWRKEFRKSIKSSETEDRLDLYFYRPLGFIVAKLGGRIGLSPTQITLLGMLCGVAAGFLYSSSATPQLFFAALLFILSGVFDSADGQLARLTGRSTAFGLVLDGLCDNVVFISVYLGCIWALLPATGPWIWPVAVAAGFFHSWQSAALDFYGREYLYYTGGLSEHYRNPSCEEARAGMQSAENLKRRWLWRLRYSWIYQQQVTNTRKGEIQALYHRAHEMDPVSFRRLYREHHLRPLKAWRWLGTNSHTLGIILFAALARFDLYLAIVNLGLLNTWMVYARRIQLNADGRLATLLQTRYQVDSSA